MDTLRRKRRRSQNVNKFNLELYNSINDEERKLCYLKFILDPTYVFNDNQIIDLTNLVSNNFFYITIQENNNLGKKLIDQSELVNNLLPSYIIFYNRPNLNTKYSKISRIIRKYDLTSRNSFRYFRDHDEFNSFIKRDILTDEFQTMNFNITLYGKEVVHKSIYKKMRVKYDFHYILLNDYEATRAKIDFLKNKQLLEILGAEKIVIDRTFVKNKTISNMIGTGNDTIEYSSEKETSNLNKDIYNYKLTKGFFSSVDTFLKKVDEDKYILLSRKEILSDFELKTLIGSRIEKGLNEFNKIIKITKVSKKEMKLNVIFQSRFGISLGHKRNKKEENYFKIYSLFHGIEQLYCLDEIPLTYEGFKILNKLPDEEKDKYIDNFYIRFLKKNKCLSKHIQRLETNKIKKINASENKQDYYKKMSKNIKSFFTVEHLVESLQDINEVMLNQDGFDKMRINTIDNFQNYNNYKTKFLKRFVELNGINCHKFNEYIQLKYTKNSKDYIQTELKSFDTLKELVREFLCDPKYSILNERGYYFVFKDTSYFSAEESKERFIIYLTRYMKHVYNKIIERVHTLEFVEKHNNINILCKMDFYMFTKLCDHIVNNNDDLNDRNTVTMSHRISTSPLNNPEIIQDQEIVQQQEKIEFNRLLLCVSDNSLFNTEPSPTPTPRNIKFL